MTDYENLQARCQRGEPSLSAANNLLAECRAAIGRLLAENERVENLVSSERDRVMSIIGQYGHIEAENKRLLKLLERTVEQHVPLTELEGVPGWSRVVELVDVVTERDELRAELAGLRTGFDAQNEVIAELRKGAERYQWLRNNWFTMASEYKERVIFTTGRPRWSDLPESSVDAAIDAAMGKGGEA